MHTAARRDICGRVQKHNALRTVSRQNHALAFIAAERPRLKVNDKRRFLACQYGRIREKLGDSRHDLARLAPEINHELQQFIPLGNLLRKNNFPYFYLYLFKIVKGDHLVGAPGIEPETSILSVWRSTTELCALSYLYITASAPALLALSQG